MSDKNENVILSISNMISKKNIDIKNNDIKNNDIKNNDIKTNDISNYEKPKNYLNIKRNTYNNEKELFRNSPNYSYTNNEKINNIVLNESIYPVKIKKMAKSDIIIKEDDTQKNNNNIAKNSTIELNNKKINVIHKIFKNKIKKRIKEKKNNININNKKDIYICDICKKTYNIKNSFQKHLLTHNKKQYICMKCNAEFSDNSKLKRHLLIHSDIKQFICPVCKAGFNLKYNLKVHMRVHNNEKPYICGYPGCFAKFAQQNNLTTHLKIHSLNNTKDKKEIDDLLNFHNNIIKFNSKFKKFNSKLIELNKIALFG